MLDVVGIDGLTELTKDWLLAFVDELVPVEFGSIKLLLMAPRLELRLCLGGGSGTRLLEFWLAGLKV